MLVLGLGAQVNHAAGRFWSRHVAWLIRTQSAVHEAAVAARLRRAEAHRRPGARRRRRACPPAARRDPVAAACPSATRAPTRRCCDGVDLHLPAGSTIAIVGENGAGKTTLVKLLSRFYEPTSGTITVDGVDLRAIPGERMARAARRRVSRLCAIAAAGARIDRRRRSPTGSTATRGFQVRSSARPPVTCRRPCRTTWIPSSGATSTGGVDLSIGQWQKVALGRAMMRERILLLMLDEPTASLDAPTEHALFEHFAHGRAQPTRPPQARSPCWSVTAFRPCAWPT